jgi:hypothetical protein
MLGLTPYVADRTARLRRAADDLAGVRRDIARRLNARAIRVVGILR